MTSVLRRGELANSETRAMRLADIRGYSPMAIQ